MLEEVEVVVVEELLTVLDNEVELEGATAEEVEPVLCVVVLFERNRSIRSVGISINNSSS